MTSAQPAASPAAPNAEPQRGGRWPFWVAVTVALTAFAYLLADTQATLAGVWATLLRDPVRVGLGATLALILIVTLPLLAGATAGFLAWQGARLVQLASYLEAVRGAAGLVLRAAPLTQLGYIAEGVQFEASGAPGAEAERLSSLIGAARGVLLLGDDGAGKSTALAAYAHMLAGRSGLLLIAFGRRPLPVYLPLEWFARVAGDESDALAACVASQLRAFGAGQLGNRSLRALPHWNIVLLCDGLDEVPPERRSSVAEQLSVLLGKAYPDARMVVTSSLSAYLTDAPHLTSLNPLDRVVLTAMSASDASRLLRQRARSGRARELVARFAAPATAAHGLGSQIAHPATLAALLAVLEADRTVPAGRGHLMRGYVDVLCARAGEPSLAEQMRLLLASLAGSLRANDAAVVPTDATDSAHAAVRAWLNGTAAPHAPAETDLAPTVEAALRVGALEQPRGAECIRFAARSVEAVFAALALERLDAAAPDDPLPADLIEPRWCEPVLIWAGFASEPGRLPRRLLELPDPPASMGGGMVVPALALAAALEAFAPALTEPPAMDAAMTPESTQQHLRLVFDEVVRRAQGTEGRLALAQQLATIERYGLVDLTSHLITLARSAVLGRIVRAQAIEVLGDIGSPVGLDALLAFLPETDAVLRGAVDRAFAAAGPAAVPRLHRALGSKDERLRLRALEALGQRHESGITGIMAAITSDDAQDRETAARALSVLKATDGVPALVALLADHVEAVRLAAIEALGQMRTPEATGALISRAGAAQAAVRAGVAAALGEAHDATALATLLTLLADDAAPVRAAAAEALGKLGDERAVRPLRERLDDRDPWAQASAATALRRLGKH